MRADASKAASRPCCSGATSSLPTAATSAARGPGGISPGGCRTTRPADQLVAAECSRTAAAGGRNIAGGFSCLLYTSDAADEEDSVDLGGRRIIKKKKKKKKKK